MHEIHGCISFFILVIVVTWTVSAELSVELNYAPSDCRKYHMLQNNDNQPKLKARFLRILQLDGFEKDRKIVGNIFCDRLSSKPPKETFRCATSLKNATRTIALNDENTVFIVGVTLIGNHMASQIEYRYNEKVMGMIGKKLLDKYTLKDQTFTHYDHLYISEINLIDSSNPSATGEAHKITDTCTATYPDSLIGDHGLYKATYTPGEGIRWIRIYYDPDGLGEHFLN